MARLLHVFVIAVAVLAASEVSARSPFSLISFRRSKEVAKSSYLLTEDNGPWMIFVAAFAGDGAEAEARQLVDTLRSDFKLQAYLHKKQYDFTNSVQGKGFDRYGNPKRMRFASDDAFEEVAVLVGDYEVVDDANLQKSLKQIKYATAEQLSLRGKSSPTTRRFAELRAFQKRLIGSSQKRRKGPLGNAFATRNPMLPRELIAPKGLDQTLVAMNKGVKHSLLKNPGKYTVRVASFRGQVIIDQRKIHEIQTQQQSTDGRIDTTDERAEALTAILREQGIEAYVYHDRHESIVTVGSFETIGPKLADGTIDLIPKVAEIMQTYGPTKKPVPGAGMALAGIQPKAINSNGDTYVFDIAPLPILVPRRSIATDYLSTN